MGILEVLLALIPNQAAFGGIRRCILTVGFGIALFLSWQKSSLLAGCECIATFVALGIAFHMDSQLFPVEQALLAFRFRSYEGDRCYKFSQKYHGALTKNTNNFCPYRISLCAQYQPVVFPNY